MKFFNDYNLLQVVVSPTKVLNKQHIVDEDYENIANVLDETFSSHCGRLRSSDLKLSRIDYKLDITTPYKDIYIDILKKVKYIYRQKQRRDYDTSTYYKGKSYTLNLYDKAAKEAMGLHWKRYEDVLRLEIQLKSRHLKVLSTTESYDMEITLQNFFSNNIRHQVFKNILYPMLYRGDYYSVRKIRYILNSYGYTDNMAEKLLQFQRLISIHGITGAIELSDKSKNTTRSYIKKLEDAGVNPIPLPNDSRVNYLQNMLTYLSIK
jgi:hypothetical protein